MKQTLILTASALLSVFTGQATPQTTLFNVRTYNVQSNPSNVWQTTVSDLSDPKNLGVGDIAYWVVLGNVGAVDQFFRDGGATIRARRIGSPSAGN